MFRGVAGDAQICPGHIIERGAELVEDVVGALLGRLQKRKQAFNRNKKKENKHSSATTRTQRGERKGGSESIRIRLKPTGLALSL